MSNPKFAINATVIYQGQSLEIMASIKDFATNKINYRLSNDKIVSEADLLDPSKQSSPEKTKPNTPVQPDVFAEYKTLFGKDVPPNKKKDMDWINTKIAERKAQNDPNKDKYDAISALDRSQLAELISLKELDIDINDYEDDEEGLAQLIAAVCQELGVNVPE